MKFDLTKYTVELIDLFGIEQEFKLCHIPFLVADDVLGALALEGSSGTGKTTVINRIGKLNELLTGGKVKTYSADKARYEDFNGCPLPDDETKQMVIYPMPNSVSQMETVLVDEINRASYENQEKWLSLFATRKIDGLSTKCRYLFAAMNPVMVDQSNTFDTYEGVQPLDKALGERMMGLVRMTPFHKMSESARHRILKGGINQANWKPTDEAVGLYEAYINRARELYEENKVKYSDRVASYIDAIQCDLKQEKSGISVEARRGQYMFSNILAIHALDNVTTKIPIETSALNALLVSFPNPLWEQSINPEALKQAHNRAVQILKLSTEDLKKSASNFTGLERPITEILEFAKKSPKPSREQLTKVISQNVPKKEDNPINHYIFCLALYESLTTNSNLSNGKKTQTLLKEQDFSRVEKSAEKILNSPRVKDYLEYNKSLKDVGKLPPNAKLPEFLSDSISNPDIDSILRTCTGISYGIYCLVLAEMPEVLVTDPMEIIVIMEKLGSALHSFNELRGIFQR